MLFGSDGNNNMLRDVTGVKRGDTVGINSHPINGKPIGRKNYTKELKSTALTPQPSPLQAHPAL
jgi:hypothetical protein